MLDPLRCQHCFPKRIRESVRRRHGSGLFTALVGGKNPKNHRFTAVGVRTIYGALPDLGVSQPTHTSLAALHTKLANFWAPAPCGATIIVKKFICYPRPVRPPQKREVHCVPKPVHQRWANVVYILQFYCKLHPLPFPLSLCPSRHFPAKFCLDAVDGSTTIRQTVGTVRLANFYTWRFFFGAWWVISLTKQDPEWHSTHN